MVKSGLTDKTDVSHYRLSLHLGIAFIILCLTLWNYFKISKINISGKKIPFYLPNLFFFIIFVQIIIGAFVSGMDAGQIYNTWPSMNGNYFPDNSSVKELFKINVLNEPSLMQFIHRNIAYLTIIIFCSIIYIVFRNKNFCYLKKTIFLIFFILLTQVFLGILTVLYGTQILIASLHQIGSIFLISSSLYLFYKNTNIN
jgi:cytochrome c oxidase assembly protein subunit 15